MASSPRPPISTHILDISQGKAVAGLEVTLHRLETKLYKSWELVNSSISSDDGRCADFTTREDFKTGTYKFRFEVGKYFEAKGVETLYPFIEIYVKVTSTESHYHIPLLLSPFGYSTYRGT